MPAKREKRKRKLLREKPMLLIGSPMCTAFSALQNLLKAKRDPLEMKRMLKHAITHLCFCAELYTIQVDGGRYFLHEHPHSATSWSVACMQKLLAMPGVVGVRGDMCPHGVEAQDQEDVGRVLKPTGWATNSQLIAK